MYLLQIVKCNDCGTLGDGILIGLSPPPHLWEQGANKEKSQEEIHACH